MLGKQEALPQRYKIFFAIGGLGENVVFQAATAWLFFFWAGQGDSSKALIPLGLLGVLLSIGRFIEAFDDPLIGHMSDKTQSKFGRRFPYIFFGAPFLALSFFLLWIPIEGTLLLRSLYFFVVLQCFFLTYTLVSAPYEGVLPELAKTSSDRVSASSWRVLFGILGAALGLVGSSFLITRFGFMAMASILGITAIVSFWISILGIRKRVTKASHTKSHLNFFQAIIIILKNKHFMIFSVSLILFSLGFNLLNALLPFYVKVVLKKPEVLVGLFSGIILASMLIVLPIQTRLAQKYGKNKIYAYSMLGLSFLFPLLGFIGIIPSTISRIDPLFQTIGVVIAIGIALSGQFIFPNAILADIIDFDAKQTGLRREAIFYGIQNTLQKFSFALSSLIFGTTLSLFGSTMEQPLGIRLIGPIAGFFSILGFFVFIKMYKMIDT